MISISPAAAAQILESAKQTDSENLCLRLAAQMTPDETVDYGMGFDQPKEDDVRISSEGVDIIVAPAHIELLHGTHIDYVELEPGQFNFIFLNPNDPSYKPPKEE